MRAYKGLDAHNQFTSGWVKDVEVSNVTETLAVVKGRVSTRVSTNYLLLCFNPTFFSSNTCCTSLFQCLVLLCSLALTTITPNVAGASLSKSFKGTDKALDHRTDGWESTKC